MTHLSRLKYLLLAAFSALYLFTLPSCAKNHSEMVLESLQAIEYAMRTNLEDPEKLLTELDACIEKYGPVWEKSHHLLETRTKDSYKKEVNLQIVKLRATAREIIDLDLEIQDRLEDRPELLKAYEERVKRIGYVLP